MTGQTMVQGIVFWIFFLFCFFSVCLEEEVVQNFVATLKNIQLPNQIGIIVPG